MPLTWVPASSTAKASAFPDANAKAVDAKRPVRKNRRRLVDKGLLRYVTFEDVVKYTVTRCPIATHTSGPAVRA